LGREGFEMEISRVLGVIEGIGVGRYPEIRALYLNIPPGFR
jgi:hypothetical protein